MAKVFTITEGLENLGALKSGGQGSVYKAKRSGEIITAIKILPTPISSETEDDKNFISFQNEVQKLKKVNETPNPNIVGIIASGITTTGNLPYIEMEYIEGPDLGELLTAPHDRIFTIKEIIKVADHLSNALAHCHRSDVKHGDIKSNNVKFNQRTGNYMLLDFGLSIMSDEQRRSSIRHAGAIEFMAPEQNAGTMLFETDIYSFGIIMFELLAGTVPFPLLDKSERARNNVMIAHMETAPPDVLQLRRKALPASWSEEKQEREMQVPAWLTRMIYRCLEKEPADRFRDGASLHDFIHSGIIAEENRTVNLSTEQLTLARTHELQLSKQIESLEEQAAKKDELIEDLQMQIELKDKALYQFQYVADYTAPKSGGISKSLFFLVFLLALGFGGYTAFTAYNNYIKPEKQLPVADSSLASGKKALDKLDSAFEAGNKLAKKGKRPVKKSIAIPTGNSEVIEETTDPASETAPAKTAPITKAPVNKGIKYKVIKTAYFHILPEKDSRSNAFIPAGNTTVTSLNEKDGFIFVAFSGSNALTIKGWLSKDDLEPTGN